MIALLAVALPLAMAFGISLGTVDISVTDVFQIVAQQAGLPLGSEHTLKDTVVVTQIRMPRVLVGALVGSALGVSGTAMQGVFRNALAEPGVVGVSAGGALGAVVVLAFGLSAYGTWVLPVTAFIGSASTLGLVFLASRFATRRGTATLLLIGIAINAFLGALISILVATADNDDELRSIVFWLQGGLDARTWAHVHLIVVPVILGLLVMMIFSRDLNVFGLGDEQARATGVDVRRSRTAILTVAALLTGVSVAVTGTISFVGVVVPHALRLLIGPDHRTLLPASALGGATFLVLADLLARTLFQPVVLQVGIVTALIGAPVLLFFVLNPERRGKARS